MFTTEIKGLAGHSLSFEERNKSVAKGVIQIMKAVVGKIRPIFELNFEFPRPREHDLDDDMLFSTDGFGFNKLGKQKDIIGFERNSSNLYVKLIRGVLNGKHDEELRILVDNCKDVNVLENLRLTFKDDARFKDPKREGENAEITLTISLLHLAVLENKPLTLSTLLTLISSEKKLEDVISQKVLFQSEQKTDQLQQEDIFMCSQNLLHLATEYSKDCLQVLLSGDVREVSKRHLKSVDGLQRTTLHLAARNSTSECVISLINEKVFNVDAQDINGDTPLHLAGQGCEETMYILLVTAKKQRKNIDIQNNKKRTPIFYARTQKMVLLLYNFSDRTVVDIHGQNIMERYLAINEDCAEILLSTGITSNNKEYNDRNLLFIYDLDIFYGDRVGKEDDKVVVHMNGDDKSQCDIKKDNQNYEDGTETKTMQQMLDYGRDELLSHPLVETFLYLRWLLINKFFYINFLLYAIYLLSFTFLVLWTSRSKYIFTGTDNIEVEDNKPKYATFVQKAKGLWVLLYLFTGVITVLIIVREIYQAYNEGRNYLRSKENIIEMIALGSSLTYILWVPWKEDSTWDQFFAAVAMFLAWMEVTLLLGRVPSIGMFTHMATHIISKMGYFIFIYGTTLFAFAITLHLLLIRDTGVFENIWTTFLKVLVMMIGEYDFAGTFTYDVIIKNQAIENKSAIGKAFPFIIQCLFLFLMFFVSIIIANLVTGLTVSNIDGLQKESGIRKLRKTLGLARSAEEIIGQTPKFFKRMYPNFWKTNVHTRIDEKKQENNLRKSINSEKHLVCVQPNVHCTLVNKPLPYIENEKHDVFLYDENRCLKGKKIDMEIPSTVVMKTFHCLREKNKLQKELNSDIYRNSDILPVQSGQIEKSWTQIRKKMIRSDSIPYQISHQSLTIPPRMTEFTLSKTEKDVLKQKESDSLDKDLSLPVSDVGTREETIVETEWIFEDENAPHI